MNSYSTPVLFIIFNRPSYTKRVFEAIKEVKPAYLYIAADGPRKDVKGEASQCAEARKVVSEISWECEVKTLFRDENLGCRLAVSSGIDWFFSHVEEGIILEDDCVPDFSFFGFCEQLLSFYRYDERIMMICGTNYLPKKVTDTIETTYYFSNYFPIWGWATWRRAWSLYDVEIKSWQKFRNSSQMNWLFSHEAMSKYYTSMFDMIKSGLNTWDIQWWFTCIFQNGLAIVPKTNLISNIGISGTHSDTQGNFFINAPTIAVDLEKISHPEYVFAEKALNELTYTVSHAHLVLRKNYLRKVFEKIKVVVKRIFK